MRVSTDLSGLSAVRAADRFSICLPLLRVLRASDSLTRSSPNAKPLPLPPQRLPTTKTKAEAVGVVAVDGVIAANRLPSDRPRPCPSVVLSRPSSRSSPLSTVYAIGVPSSQRMAERPHSGGTNGGACRALCCWSNARGGACGSLSRCRTDISTQTPNADGHDAGRVTGHEQSCADSV
jgi:hypothetical protein